MFKFKKKIKEKNKEHVGTYDKEYKVEKLKLFVVIVDRSQGLYFVNEFKKVGVGASFEIFGKGTATKEIYDFLGVGETKKDIVLSLVKETKIEELKEIVNYRFNGAKKAKGIAFSISLDSLAGVLIYRYLTNTKENIKKEVK